MEGKAFDPAADFGQKIIDMLTQPTQPPMID
jgi:hypothetical protein